LVLDTPEHLARQRKIGDAKGVPIQYALRGDCGRPYCRHGPLAGSLE
jgi:hypothetical protein